MGQNLILNMNDHGNVVCAYNRTPDKVTKFLENEAKNTNVSPYRMIYLLHTKGGLISESFSILAPSLPIKMCQKLYLAFFL